MCGPIPNPDYRARIIALPSVAIDLHCRCHFGDLNSPILTCRMTDIVPGGRIAAVAAASGQSRATGGSW